MWLHLYVCSLCCRSNRFTSTHSFTQWRCAFCYLPIVQLTQTHYDRTHARVRVYVCVVFFFFSFLLFVVVTVLIASDMHVKQTNVLLFFFCHFSCPFHSLTHITSVAQVRLYNDHLLRWCYECVYVRVYASRFHVSLTFIKLYISLPVVVTCGSIFSLVSLFGFWTVRSSIG